MNKLAKLRQTLADLKVEGTALVDAAEANGGEFSEEQNARMDEIETEIEQVSAEIASIEALNERRRAMEAVPAGHNAVHDTDPAQTGGFASIGEFAVAVHQAVNASQLGGTVDPRLRAAPPNNHLGGGSAGEGYNLPPQFRDEVWSLVTEFDEFGPLIDEEPTSAREVKLVADQTTPWGSSGIRSYWRSEGSQMTPTQLADEGRSVPLHELYTLVLATDELLEDAPRLASRITQKAAMAIAWKKNLAVVDGSGVGQPLGWMNSPALITVAKESGQAADTITAANVLKMMTRLRTVPGDTPFWLISQDALPALATITIGDKPVWMPPNGLVDAPGGFLLGKPVRFSEFAETIGDKGDIQLVSPRGYYAARRSQGVQFASSIHLYFDYATQAFRWMFRYGGQPHLSGPVSPAKGNTTTSHFVTLAERA